MHESRQRRVTGGEAIADSLIAHGIDTIFGIPGIQMDHLFVRLSITAAMHCG